MSDDGAWNVHWTLAEANVYDSASGRPITLDLAYNRAVNAARFIENGDSIIE